MRFAAGDGGGAGGVADGPAPPNPVLAGIGGSFAFPFGDLLLRKHDSALLELLDGLTVAPGLAVPLDSRRTGVDGAGASKSGDRLSASSTLALSFHYQPVGFWFAQISVATYLEPHKRSAWNGDFTYGFGYDDYHPYTFSLTYSNYGDNRFAPLPGQSVTEFDHGAIYLAWKAPVPERLARPFLIDQSLTINCHVGYSASPRYDTASGGAESWKTAANLDCVYPLTAHLFGEFNALKYQRGQQPWDPDFTYSFGMADYRTNHFSIIYANYSGNRYPGRATSPNTGHFANGGVFISWNHGF
jgi:hypothetical protein